MHIDWMTVGLIASGVAVFGLLFVKCMQDDRWLHEHYVGKYTDAKGLRWKAYDDRSVRGGPFASHRHVYAKDGQLFCDAHEGRGEVRTRRATIEERKAWLHFWPEARVA